jgi:hypothetical protein
MLWKLLGLQKKLDALFDDGWVTLGLSSGRVSAFVLPRAAEYPGE